MADSAARLAGVSELQPLSVSETNSNTLSYASDFTSEAISLPRMVDFVQRDGVIFAGTHLLIEFWDARNLSDLSRVESALVEAARAAGATVLHSYFHPFGPELGISGVVVLAESHISIHTWPEQEYAAIDVFMCGDCDPADTLPVLKEAFAPGRISVAEHLRGLID